MEGAVLSHIGKVYYGEGHYDKALKMYQQALRTWRKAGKQVGEEATLDAIMFIGEAYCNQGRYYKGLEIYEYLLTVAREMEDQARESAVLNNIGIVYQRQERYANALEMYEQALAITQEREDQTIQGAILNNIGSTYGDQRHYSKALKYLQKALAIQRKIGDRLEEATTLNNIGIVYHGQGHLTAALEMYQQALTIARKSGDQAKEGLRLTNIGGIYYHHGHYSEALTTFQQALIIHRKVGNIDGEGRILQDFGKIYRHQGQYAQALEYFQQALLIIRKLKLRIQEGNILDDIGLTYLYQHHYAQALTYFHHALIISREMNDLAGEGAAFNDIGMVYAAQGRYPEALNTYQRALTIRQEAGVPAGIGGTLANMGTLYVYIGRYAEAVKTCRQALAILRKAGNRTWEGQILGAIGVSYNELGRYAEALEVHQQVLALARGRGDLVREGIALSNIGRMYYSQGRYGEALEDLQQALLVLRKANNRFTGITLATIGEVYRVQRRHTEALDAYQQAMDILEEIRTTAGSEQGRASFIARYAGLYAHTVGLLHQQGQDEEAFFISERGRARTFLDSLATGHIEPTDNEAADLLAQEQAAYARRQAIRDELARVRALNPPNPKLAADLEAQLTEIEATYAKTLAAIQARGDQLAALVPGRSAVLGLAEAQGLLDEQTTLLSYFVLEEQTLVFLITRRRFEVIEIEVSAENLGNRIRFLYQIIPDLPEAAATQQAAEALYKLLITPLSVSLHTPRLAIVPHGPLHYLPFAALLDPNTEEYLAEQYTLITLPSASALPFIRQNAAQTSNASEAADARAPLILGNPVIDAELPPLHFAEREARTIANLYGVEPLLGAAATENALREGAGQANILHLAAHGTYNPYNPLYSTIYLSPDETHDGRLEVHKVYGLNLKQTELVVLSACETQLGNLSAGDELVGLTRAFFFAGTPAVIASLWRVEDKATAILMERFYRHLQAKMGKAAALRQAQIDMIEDYPAPYYWSGFMLSGDGS